jgi:hypothetical protein
MQRAKLEVYCGARAMCGVELGEALSSTGRALATVNEVRGMQVRVLARRSQP